MRVFTSEAKHLSGRALRQLMPFTSVDYACAKLHYRIAEQQQKEKKEYRNRPNAAPDLRIQISSTKKENSEEREQSHSSYRNLQICGILVFSFFWV
jgi:hypothetical protein